MTKRRDRDAARIAQLERQLAEAEAQLPTTYHQAFQNIDKASEVHLRASGVLVTLTALGGRQICRPFVIKDGLSMTTVHALRADLKHSFTLATDYKL